MSSTGPSTFNHTFQSLAAAATGNGTALKVLGRAQVLVEISLGSTGTINWEGLRTSGTWRAIPAVNIATFAVATTATASGFYIVPCLGLEQVRARVSANGGSGITVEGQITEDEGALSLIAYGINASGTLVSPTATYTPPTADGVGAGSALGLPVTAALEAYNNSTFDRLRTNAAALLAAATQPYNLAVAEPAQWSVTHQPAANTQATASKAAGGAGVRHVCQAILATLTSNAAAAAEVVLNVRDGATGAGTVIFTARLAIPATADSMAQIALSGLSLLGSANTAMTLEFAGAGGANTLESVSMAGYSTI